MVDVSVTTGSSAEAGAVRANHRSTEPAAQAFHLAGVAGGGPINLVFLGAARVQQVELSSKQVVMRPYRDDDAPLLFAAARESTDTVSIWMP